MKFEAFDVWVRGLPGVTFDVKWGVHRTFCIGDKMFVMAGDLGEAEPKLTFKASDLAFEILTESEACVPAPYLGRAKWVRMVAPDSLSDEEVKSYVAEARRLVASKLPKKHRVELGIG